MGETGMTEIAVPEDGAARLQKLVPFGRLDHDELTALAASVQWLHAPAGVRLFSVGEAPDGMYGILSGRIRFFGDDEGREVLTADAGPGVTFGEVSLLVGGGRSRTAVVARDALLVKVSPERFAELMSSAHVAAGVASLYAARFAARPDPAAAPDHPVEVVVDAAIGSADRDWFIGRLARAAGERANVTLLDSMQPDDRTTREADVVLLLRRAADQPPVADHARWRWPGLDPLAAPRTELVLLREPGSAGPVGSAAWTAAVAPTALHHVRRGVGGDVRRVARLLTGTATGLVLGGGGARGMAHIGVLRALDELGMAVDSIGGSSMGAVVGAQAAAGRRWDEVLDESERVWTRRGLRLDLTLPTVSVSSGRRARRMIDELFDSIRIEDLLLPYFCTTTNLSRFELAVHRSGPAAQWVLASTSAPGLWPPVVDESGELHIDGGQLDNVPTDVMRRAHPGPLLAVDVCATQQAMTVAPGAEPAVGLRHLLHRRSVDRFPSLVDTINRCALLTSLQQRARAADQADVYLTPDLSSVGFRGFRQLRQAVEIGYRTAMAELDGVAHSS
jgi:NTE family protein